MGDRTVFKIWLGASVIWIIGVYAAAWLAADSLWPPPVPGDMTQVILIGALLIGPPLLVLLAIKTIAAFSRTSDSARDE